MTRAELIQYITDNVYPNARNEVTAQMVRDSLLEIVDFLGDAATYNIGMVASGNQGLVTGGNVNTAIALALLPYYTAEETGQAIDAAIARLGLGQAAFKDLGQVADGNTGLVMGGQVYSAINAAITSAVKFQGVSDTPLTDGSTTNPIQIDGQLYTAKKGDMVVYGGNEFLWVGNKWQQMGDESSYALKTIQIIGTGYLTGGGDLTQSRTLDISATAKAYIDHGEAAYNYFPGGVLGSTHLPSMYIGTTSVQFTAAAQNLTGVSSVRATNDISTLFEWDSTNSAWHFHGNIYTDGWFSGGGISTGGGGGGGGIDPVAMWRLLTNNPSLTQYDNYTKISADHINFPVTSVVGLTGAVSEAQIAEALGLGSLAYKSSLSVSDIPDLSGKYLPLTGGFISSSNTDYPLEINSNRSGSNDVWLYFYKSYVAKSAIGYYAGLSFISNETSFARIGVNDSGVPQYWPSNAASGAKTLYHSGNSNKSDVAWACSTLNATTSVTCSSVEIGNSNEINSLNSARLHLNYRSTGDITLAQGGGNVGIRTNSPSYNLDVNGSAYATSISVGTYLKLTQGASSATSGYVSAGGGYSRNSGKYGVKIIACDQSDIQSGLGQDCMGDLPYDFSVVGGKSGGYGYISFVFHDVYSTTYSRAGYFNQYGDLNVTRNIDSAGVIHAATGIWTNGYFSGGGLSQSSDRRLKKSIKDFAYSAALLMSIRPREWDWNEKSKMKGHAAGFVAQEIEPIMPYAVDGTRNYKALFYDRFHALEIAALQDHERRIKALEDENEKIRRENIELKKRLNRN